MSGNLRSAGVLLFPGDVLTVDLPAVSRLTHLRNAIWRQRDVFVLRIAVEAEAAVPVTLTVACGSWEIHQAASDSTKVS